MFRPYENTILVNRIHIFHVDLKVILFELFFRSFSSRVAGGTDPICILFKCFGFVKSQCSTSAAGGTSLIWCRKVSSCFMYLGQIKQLFVILCQPPYLGSSDSLGIARWSATCCQSCIAWPRLENLERICFYPRHWFSHQREKLISIFFRPVLDVDIQVIVFLCRRF